MAPLPAEYHILPHAIPFRIPGFEKHRVPGALTLAPEPTDCGSWFNGFVDRVARAIETHRYLPVLRLSDGEFIFLCGPQPFSRRLKFPERTWKYVKQVVSIWRHDGGGFSGATAPGVSVGRYNRAEVRRGRELYADVISLVSRRGIIAAHLNWEHVPFQEHFFPAFGRWLHAHGIRLSGANYAPFYFVYALMTGPRRGEILKGRRVLVLHSASGAKRMRIEQALHREHVAEVAWCGISTDRSLHDRIDPSPWKNRVDLCLLGGGVGKVNLLRQLEPLGVPCLDIGYVFEAWADPEMKWRRSYMVPDEEMDLSRAHPYGGEQNRVWLAAQAAVAKQSPDASAPHPPAFDSAP